MERQKQEADGWASDHLKGEVVEAQVRFLNSFEAIVALKDGTVGIIRNRELSWGQEPKHPGEVLRAGQNVRAFILGIDRARRRLKMSLRLAERNPWEDISRRYKPGQVVRCKVTGLLPKTAYTELEPGVRGCLPLREICDSPPACVDDVIWIGDTIEAVITNLKPRDRIVTLSTKKRLSQLKREQEKKAYQQKYCKESGKSGTALLDMISNEERLALLNFIKEHDVLRRQAGGDPAASPALQGRTEKVLVADDDRSFRMTLQHLLRRLGHVAEVAESAEDAVRMCADGDFDLVLMDMWFRRDAMSGLQAVREITRVSGHPPVLMITGLIESQPFEDAVAKLKSSGARGLLLKPVDLCFLKQKMAEIAEGRDCWESQHSSDGQSPPVHLSPLFAPARHGSATHKSIAGELARLQAATQATTCILFKMNGDSGVVEVIAHAGMPLHGNESSRYMLQASPIREVIMQGQVLFVPDTSRNEERFRYLNLTDFSSCVGVPVASLGQTRCGLFVFHREPGHLRGQHLLEAKASAAIVGSVLDRREVEGIIRRAQPLIFAGQIGSTLVHELNNRLSSVLYCAEALLLDHERIDADISNAMNRQLRQQIKTSIRNLEDNAKAMEKITGLYLGLMTAERHELVDVNEDLRRALGVLAPVADRHKVEVRAELEDNLPGTVGVSSWLEQAFVNVALNAIQNMGSAKGAGTLVVRSRFARDPDSPSIQVSFTDTGQGIHGQHLGQVFSLGFSTRHDGTGLGLFTTRGIVETLGGRISVPESVMLVGTTFLIELPLIIPSAEVAS